MRIGTYLVALALFAAGAGASEWRTPSNLPSSGLSASAYGFTFHSPGAGWEMMNTLPPVNGRIWGEYGLQFLFPTQHDDTEIPGGHSFGMLDVTRFEPWRYGDSRTAAGFEAMMREEFDAARVYQAKGDPTLTAEFKPGQINGANCATWEIRSKALPVDKSISSIAGPSVPRIFVDRRRTCLHPDLPFSGISMDYMWETDVGSAPDVALKDGDGALSSLQFVPIPFRIRQIRLPGEIRHIAEADESIWVSYLDKRGSGGTVARIDPSSNGVITSIPFQTVPDMMAASGDGLWVQSGQSLLRIDPKSNRVTGHIKLPKRIRSLDSGGGFLWAMSDESTEDFRGKSILRIDPTRGTVDEITQAGGVPRALIFAEGALYVHINGALMRFDPATLKLQGSLSIEDGILHFDGRYLWNLVPTDRFVSASLDPEKYRRIAKPYKVKLVRIDLHQTDSVPVNLSEYTTPTFSGPYNFVWWNGQVCMQLSESVSCVDPARANEEAISIPVGDILGGDLLVATGSVWTTSMRGHVVTRIDVK
jgi:hypothetical protein